MHPKLTSILAITQRVFILKDQNTKIHLLPISKEGEILTNPIDQILLAERIRELSKELNICLKWGGCYDLSVWTYSKVHCPMLYLMYLNRLKSKCRMPYIDLTHFELSKKEL